MSTFLGGWHFLKWVKKWRTLAMPSSLLVSWTNIVVITWIDWCELFSTVPEKFCSQFSLVGDILTVIKHESYSSIQGLYRIFSTEFIRDIIFPYMQNCNLDVSLYKIKSHWLYILGGWDLNRWINRWFIGTTLSTTFQEMCSYCMYKMLQHLFWIVFWKLNYPSTTKWRTYSQYKKVYWSIQSWYLKVIYPAWLKLNHFLQIGFKIDS